MMMWFEGAGGSCRADRFFGMAPPKLHGLFDRQFTIQDEHDDQAERWVPVLNDGLASPASNPTHPSSHPLGNHDVPKTANTTTAGGLTLAWSVVDIGSGMGAPGLEPGTPAFSMPCSTN